MFKQLSFGLALALVLALCPFPVNATLFYGFEDTAPVMTYEQPNEGTPVTFNAKMWGNSLIWEHEDDDGYTIVKNYGTGYWCYAILNESSSNDWK